MSTVSASPSFYSQTPELKQAALDPNDSIPDPGNWTAIQKQVAGTFNRVGGLIQAISARIAAPAAAAVSVWYVESGGAVFVPNRAIIRFEVHHFWGLWGARNQAQFDAHFQFGGHNGILGAAFKNHAFREDETGPFLNVHKNQASEYSAFGLATNLAGEEAAVQCISIGGPQIMGSNFPILGYPSAKEMYDAFQADEHAHVLGFFDFCAHKPAPHLGGLITYLQQKDWASFARFYNGNQQVAAYSTKLRKTFEMAAQFPPLSQTT